ncbi:CLN_G0006370.mRNA.1.CDS.1 [Saccharomyces cerevisiae]|nr:CLN_G0006370.mRNA.1.CDS.1 [Saccharomyces cerevisiae]CAI7173530.1 CLN_G0006370.mRNA.1.CDS.1 [Saccharomyces cerevisiae]
MNSFASLGLIYSVVNLLTRVEAQIVFYQNSSTSLPVSTLVSTSIADFHESSSTGEVRYSSSYSYVQPSIDSFTSSSFLTSFEAPTETSSSYAVSSSLITSDTFSSYSDIFDEETSSLISTSAASSEKASSTLSSTAQPHRTSHSSSSFELPVTAPSSSSLPSSTSLTFTSVNPSQSWTSFNSEKSSALSSTIEFTSSEISGSTSPKSLESLDTTGTITSSYSPSPSSKNSNQTSLLSPLEPLSSSSGDLILSSTIQATTNDQTSKTIPTLVDATSSLPPTLRSSSMAPTSGSDSISHNFTSPPSKTSGNYDVLTSNSIDPSLFTTTSEYSSTQLSSLNQASKSETVNFTASIASTPFGTDSATSLIDPISSVGSTASSFVGISTANFSTQGNSNYVPESTASGSSQYQDWSSSSLPLSQTTWVVINTTNTQGSVTSTTSPAYVSTATKTVDGVITEYVTWCPLTQTKSQAIGVSSSMSSVPQASSFSGSSNSTTLVASNNVPESTASGSSQYQDWSSSSLPLSQTTWVVINTTNTQGSVTSTTSPAYVSTATKTVDGVITEYVTWCPLTQTKSQAIGVSSSTISATQTSKPSSILTLGISTLQLSDATFKGTETINTHLMTESTSITEPTYFSGTSDSFYLSTSEVNLASSLSSYPNFSSSEGSTATITNSTVTFGSTSKYPSASVSNPTEASQHVSSSVNSLTDFTSNSTETIAVISNIHKTSSNKDYSLTTTQLKTSGMQTLVLSTVTTTVNGAATEYTTWCPATSIAYTTSISYKTLVLTTEVCSHSECTPTVITSVTATSSTIPLSSTSSSTVLSSTVSEGTKNPAASEVTTNTQVSATSEATSTSTSVTATASESSTTSQVSATSVRATSSESSTTSQVSTASETISTLGTQNFTTTGSLLFPALSTEMINTTVVSRKTLIISTEVCSHSKCVPTVITEVVTSKGTPSNGHSSQTLQTEAVEVTLSSHQTVTMSTEVCSNSICTPTVITSVQMRSTPSPYLTSSTSSSSLASTKKSSLEASSEMSTFSVSTQSLPLAFTSSEKRSTTSVSQWSSTVLTNTIMSSSSNVISTNEKPSSTTSPYNFSSGYSLPSSSTPSQYSLSTATTTINGIKTVYTTWCPLAEKSTVAASSQSSRSVDRFVSSSKPSSSLSQTSIQYTLSTATTTISGLKTVYTTWCPLTSKSTLGATTQTSSTAKVRITSASSATSTSISLSTSTESESSSGYLSKGICSGTECTQDVPTESSSPASTLAYSPSVSTSSSSFSTTTASTLTSTHTSVPLLPSSSSISASSPSSTSMLSTSLPSPAFTSSTLPTAIAVSSSTFIASSLPFSSKSSLSLSPVSSSILMSQFSSSSSSSSSSSLASLPSLSISPTVDTVSVLQPTTSIATLTCTDSQCQQEVSTICNGSNCDDVTSTATTPPSTVTDTMTCTGSECQKTTSSSCDGYSCKVSETYKSSATISACSGEGCQASATSELNSQYVTMTSVITPSAITTTSVEVHSTESTISITTVKPVTYTSSDTNGELITITSSSQTVIPSVTTIITRTKVAITSTPKPTTTTYVEQRLSSSGIATSFVAAASSTWITTPIVSTYAGSASKFLCSKFFMIMVMVINFI